MGELHATIYVDVAPDRAFDAFANPDGIAQWFPRAKALIDRTGPLDQAGTTYTLKFAGPVRADCTITAVDRPLLHERTFHRRPLGIRGRARMRFLPDSSGTRIELDGTYTLPGGPLGHAIDKLLPSAGDRGARAELTRFKAFLENTHPEPGSS